MLCKDTLVRFLLRDSHQRFPTLPMRSRAVLARLCRSGGRACFHSGSAQILAFKFLPFYVWMHRSELLAGFQEKVMSFSQLWYHILCVIVPVSHTRETGTITHTDFLNGCPQKTHTRCLDNIFL